MRSSGCGPTRAIRASNTGTTPTSSGEYFTQVQRLRSELGDDRVYVLDADDFFAQPLLQVEALTAWLGLAPWVPSAVEKWNARPGDALTAELRAHLREHFEPFDQELEALTGRVPSWRR